MSHRFISRFQKILFTFPRQILASEIRNPPYFTRNLCNGSRKAPASAIILDDFFNQTSSSPSQRSPGASKIAESPKKPESTKISAFIDRELPPLDQEDLARFDILLHCLKKGTEFKDVPFLCRGVYLCRRVDLERRKIFIDFIDKWWNQVQIHKNYPNFKIPLTLFHLGELNAENGGIVLPKLGKEPFIDSLIGIWSDVGLDNSDLFEINMGLTGLKKLVTNSRRSLDKSKLTRREDLIVAIDRYFETKQELRSIVELFNKIGEIEQNSVKIQEVTNDSKFMEMIRHGISIVCLISLRELDMKPSQNTLKILNDLALISLRLQMKDESESMDMFGAFWRLASYAVPWLHWRLNPDLLTPNSLSTWFNAVSISLHRTSTQSKIVMNYPYFLQFPPAIGHTFKTTKNFMDIFDPWKMAIQKYVKNRGPRPIGVPSHGHIDSILYSMGQLVKYTNLPESIRHDMDLLVDNLMEKLCSIEPSKISFRLLSQAMTGYKMIKESTRGGSPLPEHISFFLRSWSQTWRKREDFRSDASSVAAGIFYTLAKGRLNAPEFLFDELSKLFFWGLAKSKDDLASSLYSYGAACCTFLYDPSRNFEIGERGWSAWFRYAHQCIEEKPKNSISWHQFLLEIPQVAAEFQRISEFDQLKSIWERTIIEELANFRRKDLIFFDIARKKLEKEHGLIFDRRISEFLETQFQKSKGASSS